MNRCSSCRPGVRPEPPASRRGPMAAHLRAGTGLDTRKGPRRITSSRALPQGATASPGMTTFIPRVKRWAVARVKACPYPQAKSITASSLQFLDLQHQRSCQSLSCVSDIIALIAAMVSSSDITTAALALGISYCRSWQLPNTFQSYVPSNHKHVPETVKGKLLLREMP